MLLRANKEPGMKTFFGISLLVHLCVVVVAARLLTDETSSHLSKQYTNVYLLDISPGTENPEEFDLVSTSQESSSEQDVGRKTAAIPVLDKGIPRDHAGETRAHVIASNLVGPASSPLPAVESQVAMPIRSADWVWKAAEPTDSGLYDMRWPHSTLASRTKPESSDVNYRSPRVLTAAREAPMGGGLEASSSLVAQIPKTVAAEALEKSRVSEAPESLDAKAFELSINSFGTDELGRAPRIAGSADIVAVGTASPPGVEPRPVDNRLDFGLSLPPPASRESSGDYSVPPAAQAGLAARVVDPATQVSMLVPSVPPGPLALLSADELPKRSSLPSRVDEQKFGITAPPRLPSDGKASVQGTIVDNPVVLRQVAPVYPLAARRHGLEGTVVLLVSLDRDGVPSEVKVEVSSGRFDFDEAAQRAVREWRFDPPKESGTYVRVRVEFRLK